MDQKKSKLPITRGSTFGLYFTDMPYPARTLVGGQMTLTLNKYLELCQEITLQLVRIE